MVDALSVRCGLSHASAFHLSLANFARRLRAEGLPEREVERLMFHNPKWFFSQGLGLDERRARDLVASC